VTRATQAIVVTLIGAVVLRLALFGGYLDYVRAWTRIPLIICGVMLVGSSIVTALRRPRDDGHDRPRVAWLLVLPVFVVFIVQPPSLGSYVAEHQSDQPPPKRDVTLPQATDGKPMRLQIFEFIETAAYNSASLVDRPVRLVGFVSYDDDGNWYITRLSITCCAADAVSSRVQVVGKPAPPRDTWIDLVGTWVDPHVANTAKVKPQIQVRTMRTISKPQEPYES